MGKISKIKFSGRKIEASDLRGLNTRDIIDDAKIILEQPEIPDEVISVLSFHEDPEVRLAVAKRSGNSEEVLRRLAIDDDGKVGSIAKKQLRKKKSFFENISHVLGYLFSSVRKLLFFVVAIAAIAYTISLLRPAMKETQKVATAVKNITPEQKAYIACTLTLKAANPGTKDFSSCQPYLNVDDMKQKKVQTTDFNGECPQGYKLSRNLHTPVCVSEKTTK